MEMATVAYRLCPRCFRAVPLEIEERYCLNDGEPLLEHCPHCAARILSPYAYYCAKCGAPFGVGRTASNSLCNRDD